MPSCGRIDPEAVSKAIAADGLSVVIAANPARAAARAQMERLKADPQWFQRLMAGDAEATDEYEKLTLTLAGCARHPD